MNREQNKEVKGNEQNTSSTSNTHQGKQSPFEQVVDQQASQETLDDEANAEQQRKEALTERD